MLVLHRRHHNGDGRANHIQFELQVLSTTSLGLFQASVLKSFEIKTCPDLFEKLFECVIIKGLLIINVVFKNLNFQLVLRSYCTQSGAGPLTFSVRRFWTTCNEKNEISPHL